MCLCSLYVLSCAAATTTTIATERGCSGCELVRSVRVCACTRVRCDGESGSSDMALSRYRPSRKKLRTLFVSLSHLSIYLYLSNRSIAMNQLSISEAAVCSTTMYCSEEGCSIHPISTHSLDAVLYVCVWMEVTITSLSSLLLLLVGRLHGQAALIHDTVDHLLDAREVQQRADQWQIARE